MNLYIGGLSNTSCNFLLNDFKWKTMTVKNDFLNKAEIYLHIN